MSDQLQRLKTALADRYAIQEEIGAGGMATVYLAGDLKHDREVAVKVLRPDLAAVVGAERFLHEIQIVAKLNHPHILTLIDSGEAHGFLYYVMPYVQGESLRDKLQREKQLSIEDALAITQDVAVRWHMPIPGASSTATSSRGTSFSTKAKRWWRILGWLWHCIQLADND